MTILSPRSTLGTTAFILPSDLNDDWTYMAGSGHYRTADLKAALGIDELGCGCDEADENLKAAIRRAEDAEAFGAAAAARAEKAEATVERVRALTVDGDGEWVHVGDLRGALDPKPAFTLPTEAGAVILATGRGNKQHYELHRTTKGRWITPGVREDWDDERVLSAFTDHRLLGADQ